MVNSDVIPDDFPAWMHPKPRSGQWGIVIAALLGLLVGWLFLTRVGIPAITVGTHTGFMASDFARALQDGVLVPLWSPYGEASATPIGQFTAQGAAYIIAFIQVLFTDDTGEALRILMIGALMASGVGMYILTSAWGLRWGIIAAILYLLAPFVGLTVPHVLVDVSLALFHAFLPLILFAATQLLHGAPRGTVVFSALMLGVLCFIHPAGAVAAWLSGLALFFVRPECKFLLRWLGVGAAAAGISAPLWLPALLLASKIVWVESSQQMGYTISVWEWLTPVRTPAVTPQFTLGFVLPMLMIGAWVYRIRWSRRWPLLTVGTLAVVISAVGCFVFPTPWWLSLASFWAVVGGVGVLTALDEAIPKKGQPWATLIGIIVVIIISLPVITPMSGAATSDFSVEARYRYEQRARNTAFFPAGQPFPTLRQTDEMLDPREQTSPQQVGWLAVGCTGLLLAFYVRKP